MNSETPIQPQAHEDEQSGSQPRGGDLLGPDGKVDLEALRALAVDETVSDDETLRRVSFTLSRDLRKRLDKYIVDRVPFFSRSQVQKLISAEAVTVNTRAAKPSTVLRLGDVVEVVIPPVAPLKIEPQPVPIDILHEDQQLLVLNKQAGVLVHPARSHRDGTLLHGLAWHFSQRPASAGALSDVGAEDARPGVVHRLDRDTTGVIVFAKDDEAHWRLGRQFETRKVEKRYVALVHGVIQPAADVIDLPIGPHTSRAKGQREKQIVRHDEFGKHSVTIYRTLESFDGYSLLELELRTGRTHQIRVHLSHAGWPIVGDDMYGGRILTYGDITSEAPDSRPADVLLDRQALHAALLGFTHPATGAPMTFTAPLPADFARTIRLLRTHRPGAGPVNVQGAKVRVDAIMSG